MNGIGLTLAGGGGKGAYQIGVWKYLRECGLEHHICGISGASVGALNGALFASGAYEKACDIWMSITPNQILSVKTPTVEDIVHWICHLSLNSVLPFPSFAPALAAMLSRSCAFSREGLTNLIRKAMNFSVLHTSPIPCYAACTALRDLSVHYIDLREHTEREAQSILLASSAIPVLFDPVMLWDGYYCDGGIPLAGDNVPITPLYNMGIRYILVVHLSRNAPVNPLDFPDATIVEIMPQSDLGGPLDGTLDFTAEGAAWRMQMGYEDAARAFSTFVSSAVLQKRKEGMLQTFQCSSKSFQERREALEAKRRETLDKRINDGFFHLLQTLSEEEQAGGVQ